MNTKTSFDRADIYQAVTDRIVAAIEAGAGDWTMPWHVKAGEGTPVNAFTGKEYRGANVISLWVAAQAAGFSHPIWATYKQWQELGAQVRKGEKASLVVFWKVYDGTPGESDDTSADGSEDESRDRRFVARGYYVFNAAQVDGYALPELPERPGVERIEMAEGFFAALGADIRYGGNRAFYRPADDHIQMPPFEAFADPLAYYATLAHEMTHYAVTWIMPHGRCWRLGFRGIGHAAVRHNQSPSRKARS
jgi:antirestriction protein ArdC